MVGGVERRTGARVRMCGVVLHPHARSDVDVVDAGTAVRRTRAGVPHRDGKLQRLCGRNFVRAVVPAGEGAPRSDWRRLGHEEGVGEDFRHGLGGFLVLAAVVVAREHDGGAAAECLHPLDDEQHAFLAGEGGDVVRVRVGEAEGAPRPTVLQPHPGADARARCTPALASGNVRRLRQPERAAL